jgi:hypothetical protein
MQDDKSLKVFVYRARHGLWRTADEELEELSAAYHKVQREANHQHTDEQQAELYNHEVE